MRAVRYDGQSVFLDRDAPPPRTDPGSVLVRPTLVAIDAHDLRVVRGGTGFAGVIGRRFVGVVDGQRGRRVVASPIVAAPGGEWARRGLSPHDPERRELGSRGLDGCLGDLVAVPTPNLVEVPASVTDERAVFAVPVARALHASRLVRLDGKAYITVLGESVDALIGAQVMTRLNASVRLLSPAPGVMALCERWGVRHRPEDEAGRRHDQDVVVDCRCTPESFALAAALVRPRGTIILRPETPPDALIPAGADLAPIVEHELTVVGARGGSVAEGVALLAHDPIDVDPLIGRRFRLDDAVAALRAAAESPLTTVLVEV